MKTNNMFVIDTINGRAAVGSSDSQISKERIMNQNAAKYAEQELAEYRLRQEEHRAKYAL